MTRLKFRQSNLIVVGLFLAVLVPSVADDFPISTAELDILFPAFDDAQREELMTTGELSRYFRQGDALTLVPGSDRLTEFDSDLRSIDFTVGVEVLFVYSEPHREYGMEELASKLLEMSTLAGIEYYSESRQQMRELFTESFVIDNPEERNPQPDPQLGPPPVSGSVAAYQRDTTFAGNTNRIDYEVTDSSIHMLTTNDATYTWAFFPIIREGRLHSHLLILRTDDYLIYYANFGARALRVHLFEKRIHQSFYNRLVALKGWFEAKL